MRIVPEARKAWKWFSVQVLTVIAALPIVWEQLPPEAHDLVPAAYQPWVISGLALVGIIGRLIKQGPAE